MTKTEKTTQKTKKSERLPRWPFPVRNGERTEASRGLLAASKKVQRRRDACEDMPEATF